jgi:hypothetical protein
MEKDSSKRQQTTESGPCKNQNQLPEGQYKVTGRKPMKTDRGRCGKQKLLKTSRKKVNKAE